MLFRQKPVAGDGDAAPEVAELLDSARLGRVARQCAAGTSCSTVRGWDELLDSARRLDTKRSRVLSGRSRRGLRV